MKKIALFIILGGLAVTSNQALGQAKKPKEEKEVELIEKRLGGTTRKKMTIVVDGEKVTINGKPAGEYKGDEQIIIGDEVIVEGRIRNNSFPGKVRIVTGQGKKALLGVVTEKAAGGVEIMEVSQKSGAEKAGLKVGDIITGIDDTRIENPEQLSEAIGKKQPGNEVSVKYLREGKAATVNATLGKMEELTIEADEIEYNFFGDDGTQLPLLRERRYPRAPFNWEENFGQLPLWASPKPKYGLSVQDSEEGDGAEVTEVDTDGNAAKAGLKVKDIITEANGKAVKNVDHLKGVLDEARTSAANVNLKVKRGGKEETITLKVPRKIKTADL
jgi:serine protease Do